MSKQSRTKNEECTANASSPNCSQLNSELKESISATGFSFIERRHIGVQPSGGRYKESFHLMLFCVREIAMNAVMGTGLSTAPQPWSARSFTLCRPAHPSYTRSAALTRASAVDEPEVIIVGAGAPQAFLFVISLAFIGCSVLSLLASIFTKKGERRGFHPYTCFCHCLCHQQVDRVLLASVL